MMKGHTNNPNGRPKKADKKLNISLKLKPDNISWLENISSAKGISKSSIVDEMISVQKFNDSFTLEKR